MATVRVINDRRGEEGALEAIFDYVTSPAFASRVQLIYENSVRINEQVKKMRAVSELGFSKIEKLVLGMTENTLGIAGDLQGLNAVSDNLLSGIVKRLEA